MALSEPAARKPLHNRTLDMNAYYREDGLWDIEGRITDRKAYDYYSRNRGDVSAGEAVHDMYVRLTLNDSFEVVDIEVSMDAFPFSICNEVEPNFEAIKGLKVGPGWMKQIRQRVGGKHGCTHVLEMFGPLATVAFQAIPTYKRQQVERGEREAPAKDSSGRQPFFLGKCHSWAYDSPVVKELLPEWYKADEKA
ncbi:MAG: DUF2889 domain-containing protein [Alphaproteobacteria bacterium]|nr:DUF2889 domain-containing protein [Alphaproteobacteria bacterium]